VLAVTGTGFAPAKSIIEDLIQRRVRRPSGCTGGAPRRDSTRPTWSRVGGTVPLVPVTPVLSAPRRLDGHTGHLQRAVLAEQPDLREHDVYACGNPAMTAAVEAELTARPGWRRTVPRRRVPADRRRRTPETPNPCRRLSRFRVQQPHLTAHTAVAPAHMTSSVCGDTAVCAVRAGGGVRGQRVRAAARGCGTSSTDARHRARGRLVIRWTRRRALASVQVSSLCTRTRAAGVDPAIHAMLQGAGCRAGVHGGRARTTPTVLVAAAHRARDRCWWWPPTGPARGQRRAVRHPRRAAGVAGIVVDAMPGTWRGCAGSAAGYPGGATPMAGTTGTPARLGTGPVWRVDVTAGDLVVGDDDAW